MKKTIKQLNSLLLIALLGGLFCLGIAIPAEAGVIFEDNFDSQPDWSLLQLTRSENNNPIQCYPTRGENNCPVPIPIGYDGYSSQPTYYSNVNMNSSYIDSTNFRGSSGKAFTHWNEAGSPSGSTWVSSGVLSKELSDLSTGYPELYIRAYFKFQPDWRWALVSDPWSTGPQSPMMKIFRVSYYDGIGKPYAYQKYKNPGHRPTFTSQIAKFNGGIATISYTAEYTNESADQIKTTTFQFPGGDFGGNGIDFWDPGMPGDGDWHCWEIKLKVNSAPGVADGEMMYWLDGNLIAQETNIPFISSASGMERAYWNYFSIGNNIYNNFADPALEQEQWYAIDDLVISTEYIGPDYVIGENVYYISTSGSDANPGTQSQPFATFAYAFSVMQGGDTLYIMDGVYNQAISGMPSGSPGNYTKIYALNDFKAEISGDIDGDGKGDLPSVNWKALFEIKDKSYIEVRGLKIHHSKDYNHVMKIESSDNIIIRKCAIYQAGWNPDGVEGGYIHDHPLTVSGIESDYSENILIEECAIFGNGRYPVTLSVYSKDSVFRRNVVRFDSGWDSSDIEPINAIAVYKGQDWILENNVVVDPFNPDFATSGGDSGIKMGSWNSLYPETTGIQVLGNIIINLPGNTAKNNAWRGINAETKRDLEPDNNIIKNNVVIGVNNDGIGILMQRGVNYTFEGNTVVLGNGAKDGYYQTGAADTLDSVWKSNLAVNLPTATGFRRYSGTYSEFSYNGYFDVANGIDGFTCSAGCRTDDPGLLYSVRLETNSPYKGAGENGADIGATVVKRYANGVLTDENLWPFPNENEIKNIMCNTDFLQEISSVRTDTPKWCATDKTLTEYIWEYLGNPIPDDIYGSPPLTGDVNGDEIVNIQDLQACVNVFLGTETRPDFIQRAKEVAEPQDECNVLDVQGIVNIILEK